MTYLKAIWLALRIVRKPWAAPSDEPFDNISWQTAWKVARIVHDGDRTLIDRLRKELA